MIRRFDIHAHAFHPRIAAKAVAHLNAAYGASCVGDGTVPHLLERESAAGVEVVAVLCAATAPAQVIPANNYAMELQHAHPERILGFGSFHPGFERWEDELARLKRNGIRGIKLHPDFQGFRLDDPRLDPLFDACQENFVILAHVGDEGDPAARPSTPRMVADIVARFPRLTFVAAHFGGYRMWDRALEDLPPAENLWVDTSSTSFFTPPEQLRALLARHPQERLLFGSDWPIWDPADEIRRFQEKSGFSDGEMDALLGNAARLFA